MNYSFIKKYIKHKNKADRIRLFFIIIFKKTNLLASILLIAIHIIYLYLFDSPYLLTIKIIVLIIFLIEFTGLVLDGIYPHLYPKKLSLKVNPKIGESYYFIENLYYFSFAIYIYLSKSYLWPNYIMIAILGLLLGYRIAMKANRYFNKLKYQSEKTIEA